MCKDINDSEVMIPLSEVLKVVYTWGYHSGYQYGFHDGSNKTVEEPDPEPSDEPDHCYSCGASVKGGDYCYRCNAPLSERAVRG